MRVASESSPVSSLLNCQSCVARQLFQTRPRLDDDHPAPSPHHHHHTCMRDPRHILWAFSSDHDAAPFLAALDGTRLILPSSGTFEPGGARVRRSKASLCLNSCARSAGDFPILSTSVTVVSPPCWSNPLQEIAFLVFASAWDGEREAWAVTSRALCVEEGERGGCAEEEEEEERDVRGDCEMMVMVEVVIDSMILVLLSPQPPPPPLSPPPQPLRPLPYHGNLPVPPQPSPPPPPPGTDGPSLTTPTTRPQQCPPRGTHAHPTLA
eukprot:1219467-Rhodomonas_salina.1